jgi:hypothetical protein
MENYSMLAEWWKYPSLSWSRIVAEAWWYLHCDKQSCCCRRPCFLVFSWYSSHRLAWTLCLSWTVRWFLLLHQKPPLTIRMLWPCSVSDTRLLHSFHLLTPYSTRRKQIFVVCFLYGDISPSLSLSLSMVIVVGSFFFLNSGSGRSLTPHMWGGFKASSSSSRRWTS